MANMIPLCGGQKAWHRGLRAAALAAGLAACATFAAGATSERVVTDWQTGLAISGFDPVAYFTDGAPKPGRAEFEVSNAGAVWRFANEGDRAAFEDNPEVYKPQFGGYDPVAIARGASTAGHPEIWLISDSKLYLFYNAAARDAFAADPASARRAAEENWPKVLQTLVP